MNLFIASPVFINELLIQVLLGIIQGLTEFIPISSTAHLTILPRLLGIEDPGITNIASIQLGSLIAVLIYFWNDLCRLSKSFVSLFLKGYSKKLYSKLALTIIIANIPIVIVGIIIKLKWSGYEQSVLRTPTSIAIISIFMGLFLAFSEKIGSHNKNIDNITFMDSFLIGISQIFAFLPGASRSGMTISSALIRNVNRHSAARFSFLIGIPAIALSSLVEIQSAIARPSEFNIITLFVGIITAGITSWISIDFLISYLKRKSLISFVYYRVAFGIIILLFLR